MQLLNKKCSKQSSFSGQKKVLDPAYLTPYYPTSHIQTLTCPYIPNITHPYPTSLFLTLPHPFLLALPFRTLPPPSIHYVTLPHPTPSFLTLIHPYNLTHPSISSLTLTNPTSSFITLTHPYQANIALSRDKTTVALAIQLSKKKG